MKKGVNNSYKDSHGWKEGFHLLSRGLVYNQFNRGKEKEDKSGVRIPKWFQKEETTIP